MFNFKKNIFIHLLRKIIIFLNKLRILLLNYICLKFIFLDFKFKVLFVEEDIFLKIDEKSFKEYGIANNFEDLVFKIYKLFNNEFFNIKIFRKFLFLLNFSKKRDFYISFVENYILDKNFNFNNLPNLFPFIVSPFIEVGDYRIADKLMLILRKKKDIFYKRNVGLYNERSFLTAIGHLSLFSYYLKSREINFLGNDKSTFVFNDNNISNRLFLNFIIEKARQLKVCIEKVNTQDDYYNQDDHEMELWPCIKENKYYFARKMHGLVEEKWINNQPNKPFFKLSLDQIFEAQKILKKFNLLHKNKWFVGIHLRMAKDKRTLRNADIKNIIHICNLILKEGGEIFFTGTNIISRIAKRNSICFLNSLPISKEENELLQLYVWSKASFFIGNQSGGTHPPGLFGTPTIWIDVHPTVQARPPSIQDTVIPKRVFDLNENKFLTFEESNSYRHFKCQTESKFLAKISGYEITSSESRDVEEVLQFYISKYVLKNNSKNDIFKKNYFYPQTKGARYKV